MIKNMLNRVLIAMLIMAPMNLCHGAAVSAVLEEAEAFALAAKNGDIEAVRSFMQRPDVYTTILPAKFSEGAMRFPLRMAMPAVLEAIRSAVNENHAEVLGAIFEVCGVADLRAGTALDGGSGCSYITEALRSSIDTGKVESVRALLPHASRDRLCSLILNFKSVYEWKGHSLSKSFLLLVVAGEEKGLSLRDNCDFSDDAIARIAAARAAATDE